MAVKCEINLDEQRALRSLWREAHAWTTAANGFNPQYRNQMLRVFARKLAKQTLDIYFDAIDTALKNSGYLK